MMAWFDKPLFAGIVGAVALALWVFGEFFAFKNYWRKNWLRKLFRMQLGKGIYSQITMMFVGASAVFLSEHFFVDHELLLPSAFYPFTRSLVSIILPATVVLGWEAGAPIGVFSEFLITAFNIYFLVNGVTRIGGALVEKVKTLLAKGTKMSGEPHYLVCGGSKDSLEIVLEQMTNEALGDRRKPITVLLPTKLVDDANYIGDRFEKPEVSVRVGSLLNDNDLIESGLLNAQSILLLPTILEDENPDNAVLFCAKMINKVFKDRNKKRPNIVAKIVDPLYTVVLEDLVDQIICSTKRDYELSAGAIFNDGLAQVFSNLMRCSADTNEVYIVSLPNKWVNKNYMDIAKELLDKTRATNNPVSLIGVRRNNTLYLNPPENKLNALEADDKLVVLALECPDCVISQIAGDTT